MIKEKLDPSGILIFAGDLNVDPGTHGDPLSTTPVTSRKDFSFLLTVSEIWLHCKCQALSCEAVPMFTTDSATEFCILCHDIIATYGAISCEHGNCFTRKSLAFTMKSNLWNCEQETEVFSRNVVDDIYLVSLLWTSQPSKKAIFWNSIQTHITDNVCFLTVPLPS